MPNDVNYAVRFEKQLKQKYSVGLRSAPLTTENKDIRWLDARTISIPYVEMAGYKDHDRDGGFNRQKVGNKHMTKVLEHDRDVEFFVDVMDVDESNQALSAANITSSFLEQQAIPEMDSYRFSKLYADYIALGGTADTTALTVGNALSLFDDWMEAMDEAGVPEDGRVLFITPTVYKLLKRAQEISRSIAVTSSNNGEINRAIRSLDDVQLVKVQSGRMKTAYDFSDGVAPAAGAKQIRMMLVHPKSVIAANKHSYIKLWAPSEHTDGDGYKYQNRNYSDLFVIDTRKDGVMMNVEA